MDAAATAAASGGGAFRRYAVFHLSDDPGLAAFGAAWLGWDAVAAREVPHPDIGLPLAEITGTPRRYGFHGTLKPPFRLSAGAGPETLVAAVERIAAAAAPVRLAGLVPARIGSFVALVPEGDSAALTALAARCVTALDAFRDPPEAGELERRRKGLTPAQDAHLDRWGYPFVLDQFRFHLTLTGALEPNLAARVLAVLRDLPPPLPRPCVLGSVSVLGERADGRFVEIRRLPLGG